MPFDRLICSTRSSIFRLLFEIGFCTRHYGTYIHKHTHTHTHTQDIKHNDDFTQAGALFYPLVVECMNLWSPQSIQLLKRLLKE